MSIRRAVVLCGLLLAMRAVAVPVAAGVAGRRVGRPTLFGCGTGRPSANLLQISAEMRQRESELAARGEAALGGIVINTYVHVVARDNTAEGGYISADTIQKQMQVLGQAYASAGVSFVLKNSSWTVNPSWAADDDEDEMKRSLRQGTYRDLNLYFLREISGPPNTLGYCNFPGDVAPDTSDFYVDGCSLHVGTVPGGPIAGFNLGMTATHEVGHWFGLMHTFEGEDCHGQGDHVDDTPVQASNSQGCPIGRNSCPDMPGLDPIHNYMDYSSDACYDQFTSGQAARISSLWQEYRANR